MPFFSTTLQRHPVELKRRDLRQMIHGVRALYRLSRLAAYREAVLSQSPPITRFDPGHDSVMMGYDYHLSASGPRLIEVNTNAGGGLLAYLSHLPETRAGDLSLPQRLQDNLVASFCGEMNRFSRGKITRPARIAIVDEKPAEQFLHPEMLGFVRLFAHTGIEAVIADPAELDAGEKGVFHRGLAVDLIYNRHCDFYLEGPAMAGIREAYLARKVCLTPNPFTYALLGDKRRMILWSDPVRMQELQPDANILRALREQIPQSALLADLAPEEAWRNRKRLVFKPVSRFGSRGVYLGAKISRNRFDDLPPAETLAQEFVPPTQTPVPGRDRPLKTDFRLFAYRQKVLGVAVRLYQGQVTNLSSEGSGFAPVRVI